MSNNHVNDLLLAYRDGELEPAARAEVASHLAACAGCREALAAAQAREEGLSAHFTGLDPLAADASHPAAALAAFRSQVSASATPAVRQGPARSNLQRSIHMLKQRFFSPRMRPLTVGLTAVLCLVILFSIAPVRDAAADFLGLFRIRKFAVIPIDPAQAQRLEALMNQAGPALGEPTVVREEGPKQDVADAGQASALAGFPVRVPAALPEGAIQMQFNVKRGPAMHYEVERSVLESVMQAAGASTAGLPNVDKITVDVNIENGVALAYRTPSGASLSLFQTPSPDVNMTEGVDMVALSETGFQLLGMPQEEAHRLATTIDWSSTVVIPLPTDAANAREINVDGVTGLLMEGSMENRGRGETVLLWERDGILYGMQSEWLPVESLLAAANSLR
jgi:hypothetical protein